MFQNVKLPYSKNLGAYIARVDVKKYMLRFTIIIELDGNDYRD